MAITHRWGIQTICQSGTWIIHWSRMSSLGKQSHYPTKLRSCLVAELHRDHQGASRMKAIAWSYFWYPGLDKGIEDCGQYCVSCQAVKNAPSVAPLHPWLWQAHPWQWIHVDFAGPFMGKTYLLVVDAHSKWPEIIVLTIDRCIICYY